MSYYLVKAVNLSFDAAIEKTTQELNKEGFGILTEIDVKATLKKKLDVDFTNYKILGACNPPFAYEALKAEPMIGIMLPCNVVVRETEDGMTEVAAMDPVGAMEGIKNQKLARISAQVREKIVRVIERI